jgi:hypothetical protein
MVRFLVVLLQAAGVLVAAVDVFADCPPDPQPPAFEWIEEVPYGAMADEDTMWTFLTVTDWAVGDVPDDPLPPPPPWVNDPQDYYCGEPECLEEPGWRISNQCRNIADEPLASEDDWYKTDGPDTSYNCLGYALGYRDQDLWPPNCTGVDDDVETSVSEMLEVMLPYGYRPSPHCFAACDVRKAALLGRVTSTGAPGILHVTVEVGDDGWWESKFGQQYRLLHRLFDIAGGCFRYDGVFGCLERDEPGANATTCAPGYDPFADPANEVPPEICENWGEDNYLFCRDEFCAAHGDAACPEEDPDIVVVSLADPAAPEVVGRLRVGGGTEALRVRAEVAYGVKRSGESYVVDLSAAADPVPLGEHDVQDWVRGAAFVSPFAVRRTGRSLEVAETGP